jgi:hypothetical protein
VAQHQCRVEAYGAQRLVRLGLKIEEFPQSSPNLTAASQNLFELIQSGGKFKIGQLVYFHPKVRRQLDVVPGPYLITRRLPTTQDGECQYEIRNTLEEYNRVARESELTRA